ncbi:hypothetical protein ADK67_42835 [Saccharothrix sp. NRRL B-16348]|nr:hypothetical protein ADK67_42835 [Saccharothrix sp. NRRL B-16348]
MSAAARTPSGRRSTARTTRRRRRSAKSPSTMASAWSRSADVRDSRCRNAAGRAPARRSSRASRAVTVNSHGRAESRVSTARPRVRQALRNAVDSRSSACAHDAVSR